MAGRSYDGTRGELFAVAVLLVCAVCFVEHTAWGAPPAPGLVLDLVVIVLSGYILKLGDDLVDEWRLVRVGGVFSCIAVVGLCVIVARRQELFWLVAGGSLGILAARKVDHFGAVVAYLGFWLVWGAALLVMKPHIRLEFLALGAVGIASDEYLEAWATRRMLGVGSTGRLMHVLVWIAGGRWMVVLLTVTLTALARIEAKTCTLILGFELGYSFGEVKGWADRIAGYVAGVFQRE